MGNKNREFPEKCVLRPLARFPIAWMASTATAMLTSIISCNRGGKVKPSWEEQEKYDYEM